MRGECPRVDRAQGVEVVRRALEVGLPAREHHDVVGYFCARVGATRAAEVDWRAGGGAVQR